MTTVETYNLKASNGRHIRKATLVRFDSGHVVRFTERMPKREALKQAARMPVVGSESRGFAR